jgi:uncharacterized protein YndB with AHSA1/START domain
MNATTFVVDGNKLIVKRIFNAPNALVWKAWTEAELLDQWWAPQPWKSETMHMEFKEGGHRLYAMVGPEGERHLGRTDYSTILELQSFAGKDAFCDAEGNINPAMPVASFTNKFLDKNEQTEVIMSTIYPTEADLKTVIDMGMKEGLSMAYENLDSVLSALLTH